ncbi:MAG TPA: class I SAM-dependent methyltransferase [Devosia sp.]|nr:class I SAM-dependent methyltransferase [Devosia sp.]
MPSDFAVHEASGYEQLMGRWSRELARGFINFTGASAGESILDVGCGTGSLTFELAKDSGLREIRAIDFSPVFVKAAKAQNTDSRVSIRQGDAMAIPYGDRSFDRALALLVLHFVPDGAKALAEMRRVVRPGGVVAAAVWDHLGGLPSMRMLVDTAAALFDAGRKLRSRYMFQPMMRPGEMKQAFVAAGLNGVTETELAIRMAYRNFEDFWAPIAAGEGPLGQFVAKLSETDLERLAAATRDAYEAGQPDGPRSFVAVAWACRGVVP